MKKSIKSFLTALLLCLLFTTLFALPAAAESWTDPKTGEYYHVINNGSELKSVIEGCEKSDKKFHLLLRDPYLRVNDTIEIKNTNHFVFELDDTYGYVNITSEDDDEPLFFISENAPGTVLEFQTPDKDLEIRSGVLFYSYNKEDEGGAILIEGNGSKIIGGKFMHCNATVDDGGAIYVDAENVTIDGSCFYDAESNGDGGAICVNRDNCTIKNCLFDACKSHGSYGGGGVYFCSGADNGYVENCTFEDCDADDGKCVYGDRDTKIRNCSPGFGNEDNYYHCKSGDYSGSIISSGTVWIIIIIFAVVIVATVLLILKKKKPAESEESGER